MGHLGVLEQFATASDGSYIFVCVLSTGISACMILVYLPINNGFGPLGSLFALDSDFIFLGEFLRLPRPVLWAFSAGCCRICMGVFVLSRLFPLCIKFG